jgi:hypothetical protein
MLSNRNKRVEEERTVREGEGQTVNSNRHDKAGFDGQKRVKKATTTYVLSVDSRSR